MIAGASFLRALRRDGQRGQALVIGATLVLTLAALARDVPWLRVAAIAFTLLAIVLPALLELAVRSAFARGHLALAVRVSAARVLLMPGSGLGRQQSILEGLALLEQDGVEAALRHFRRLADEVDDVG